MGRRAVRRALPLPAPRSTGHATRAYGHRGCAPLARGKRVCRVPDQRLAAGRRDDRRARRPRSRRGNRARTDDRALAERQGGGASLGARERLTVLARGPRRWQGDRDRRGRACPQPSRRSGGGRGRLADPPHRRRPTTCSRRVRRNQGLGAPNGWSAPPTSSSRGGSPYRRAALCGRPTTSSGKRRSPACRQMCWSGCTAVWPYGSRPKAEMICGRSSRRSRTGVRAVCRHSHSQNASSLPRAAGCLVPPVWRSSRRSHATPSFATSVDLSLEAGLGALAAELARYELAIEHWLRGRRAVSGSPGLRHRLPCSRKGGLRARAHRGCRALPRSGPTRRTR